MSSSRKICRQFSLDEIKSATRNFDDELIIGKGGFGSVYRGSVNNGAEIVAIKRLSNESTQGETEFLREIQTLSTLQHHNLVRLEGYCNESSEKILVYEYMQNGTLVDHLYKFKDSGSTSAIGDDHPSRLTWEERLNICIGAAKGLDYLHRRALPGVIHRDIKGSNILLDGNFVAKIADFGLAKLVKPTSDPKITTVSTTIFKGTFGYMDPEYFYTQRLTTKTDIYAFGVVLLVVLSGRPAVDNKAEEDQRSLSGWATKCVEKNRVDRIIDPYLVGKISSRSLKQFVRVSLKCVRRQSEQRPTMEEVVAGLELALRKQPPSGLTSSLSNEHSNFRQMITAKLQLVSKKKDQEPKIGLGFNNFTGIFSAPKAVQGELVAAGWPSWLVEHAGEAIKGWVPRRADTFEKLDKIGQGVYSNVYKARDVKQNKLVALKKVRFDSMDPESVKFMAREILILRRLDHTNVIKLEGLVTSRLSSSVYLIFEYMEHDLAGVESLPGVKFSEPQIKCYMQQLLSGLQHCHSRGVLHRDIKTPNLLIDTNGVLKIADFGQASFFDLYQKIPLTSRVITLWYRPPELLLGANHYGVAVDLWSTGCILGELYTSKPIMPGRTEIEQLHKIFKLCGSPSEDYWRREKLPHATVFRPQQPYKRCLANTFSDLPAAALGLLETLLSMTPTDRGNTTDALNSDYFTSKPYACDPSDLPKYPPSKEIDAKLREDEALRKRASNNGQTSNYEPTPSRELHLVRVPELNDRLTRPTPHGGDGWEANKIMFSGPLLGPSNNMDEMLK